MKVKDRNRLIRLLRLDARMEELGIDTVECLDKAVTHFEGVLQGEEEMKKIMNSLDEMDSLIDLITNNINK